MTMKAEILQARREPSANDESPWSPAEFEAQLREKGRSYHIHHPFNVMLNSGRATQEQVRGWVANRWCELLPMQTELKQRLMELDSPLMRLELVSDLLARNGIVK